MSIGKLDRRIIIQVGSEAQDAYGQKTNTWSTHATVWAEKVEKKSGEGYESDQLTNTTKVDWRIRHLSTVTAKMRISWNSKIYSIEGIEEIESRNSYMLLSTELRDDG